MLREHLARFLLRKVTETHGKTKLDKQREFLRLYNFCLMKWKHIRSEKRVYHQIIFFIFEEKYNKTRQCSLCISYIKLLYIKTKINSQYGIFNFYIGLITSYKGIRSIMGSPIKFSDNLPKLRSPMWQSLCVGTCRFSTSDYSTQNTFRDCDAFGTKTVLPFIRELDCDR